MTRIVFDLDGTLIDSAPDIRGVANAILAEDGQPEVTLDQVRSFIGKGTQVFIQRLRAAQDIPDTAHDDMHARYIERYDLAVHLTVPYDDVIETLTSLRADGHVLGLCTNKPLQPTHSVLAHLRMARFFDCVLGGDSMPVRKPDPAPLQAAFNALGEGPMVYVGDGEVDAETAQRARVPFLLFTEGYRKTDVAQIPHTAAFHRFADLPGLLAEVTAP